MVFKFEEKFGYYGNQIVTVVTRILHNFFDVVNKFRLVWQKLQQKSLLE
jgi:hypothetical protein